MDMGAIKERSDHVLRRKVTLKKVYLRENIDEGGRGIISNQDFLK